ncbi:hypothetical protein BU24DRAFT_259431 [Aaosphaeria arxii CBS 175.79]|uniref:Zn(2)-C6 fungal-type domain-containing protein n=1 Tax=Aaosphaeria arxii CBS 175.79 TaxID=1450172 RepID=A0A6A5XKJ1_9PLEO|nr:uncharacterized protein BU24DRAFT_259431 [Aaosphaeria arxii CBS 175.79]KAF2012824.1 hypothetical protein BU24DRAFT_259431 [Aaosphaeria arxii CBS 175.79]
MPRLGSKKSRNGCQQCKRRRIKCDEQSPCANCMRYDFECSLLQPDRGLPIVPKHTQFIMEDPAPGAQTRTSSAPPQSSTDDATPSVPSPTVHGLSHNICDWSDTWLADLELMHHYTAHAYLSLPGSPAAKETWGFCVPQEALQFPFLMHCILAFSAYHLAHIKPSSQRKYRYLASTHQAAVLGELNKVLLEVTARNCHAIFATASMITLNAFAEAENATMDNLMEVFHLLRGMDTVLSSTESLVHNGPFATILKSDADTPRPPPLLSAMIAELQVAAATVHDDPHGSKAAMLQLKDALQHGIDTSRHAAFRATVYWPIKLNSAFIELLKSKENDSANEVLEYYLKVLELAGTDWWWLSGWRNFAR